MSAPAKRQYKAPIEGQPLMTVIVSGCKTPVLDVKFSNLIKPFFYPNSPSVPRYSITCSIDPKEHAPFLEYILGVEKSEKVESVIKNETTKSENQYVHTGKVILKFQSKNKIPVFVIEGGNSPEEIELQDELARGEKVYIMYDILRYTKKNSVKVEHGISFKPTSIYYIPKE